MMKDIVLTGIDGANPLGFLAALGVFVIADEIWRGQAYMSWTKKSGYLPILRIPRHESDASPSRPDQEQIEFSKILASFLKIPSPEVPAEMEKRVEDFFKKFNQQRKALDQMEKQLKGEIREFNKKGRENGLKGDELKKWVEAKTQESRAAVTESNQILQSAREKWLRELERIVPSDELRLGKTLSVKREEYRNAALILASSCSGLDRRGVDFLAAFAVESLTDKEIVEYTPFCFVTGSGHQYFLDTVGKLMRQVDADRIEKCLFHYWSFEDDRLSLRWAPVEDRRYALMWNNPSGEEAKTNWAANLLAYHGLRLFPVMDVGGSLGATGFIKKNSRELSFIWPVWDGFIQIDTLRSLLSHQFLNALGQHQNRSHELHRIGIIEVFECERMRVGSPPLEKLNFSISTPI